MDEETIRKLHKAKLLRPKYSDYKRLDDNYQIERKKTKTNEEAYFNVSQNCGASFSTVRRAVDTFRELK